MGRLGYLVHITAGWIDPGFHGQITLEIVNLSEFSIVLYYKMLICQLTLYMMTTPAESPYSGKYQGQVGTKDPIYLDV